MRIVGYPRLRSSPVAGVWREAHESRRLGSKCPLSKRAVLLTRNRAWQARNPVAAEVFVRSRRCVLAQRGDPVSQPRSAAAHGGLPLLQRSALGRRHSIPRRLCRFGFRRCVSGGHGPSGWLAAHAAQSQEPDGSGVPHSFGTKGCGLCLCSARDGLEFELPWRRQLPVRTLAAYPEPVEGPHSNLVLISNIFTVVNMCGNMPCDPRTSSRISGRPRKRSAQAIRKC
jgi:hypothetical protein